MKTVVLYCGLSVNNTPKLNAIMRSLEEAGGQSELVALIKHQENVPGKLFVIGDYAGVMKLFRVAWLLASLFFYLVRQRELRLVYAVNPLAGFIALLLKHLRGIPYIYETHEIFCGVNYRFYTGRWRIFWRNLEKGIIASASQFFATDPFRLKLLRRYYGITNPALGYVYNVPLGGPAGKAAIPDMRQGGRFQVVLSYCGGVDENREIEPIIRGFALLNRSDACLYLVGNCTEEYRNRLQAIAGEVGVADRLFMTGKVTNPVLQAYMAGSDITFAFYQRNSLNNRLCSPNKVFDAIHAGVPFVSSKTPLTGLIARMGVGRVIRPVSPEMICQAVSDIEAHRDRFTPEAFGDAAKVFSWHSEGEKITRVASAILGGR